MKPYMQDSDQKSIMDIINESDPLANSSTEKVQLTPGEAKRMELIRKMKSDTDKIEYMYMLNGLMLGLICITIWHFMSFRSWISIGCMAAAVIYFLLVRYKLRQATLKLSEYKNDFDTYLWEGFHIKEMRYAAVKFAYLILFPFLCVLIIDVLSGNEGGVSFTTKILTALAISTTGWFIFFNDDQRNLEAIETDLKALDYM
jgi:hypothetical protein